MKKRGKSAVARVSKSATKQSIFKQSKDFFGGNVTSNMNSKLEKLEKLNNSKVSMSLNDSPIKF